MGDGFLDLLFGPYRKMCFITSTTDTKSYSCQESLLRGVILSEHLDLHRAPPYLRSYLSTFAYLAKAKLF